MYHIYFNDRIILLSDSFERYSKQKYRLFYKNNEPLALSERVISFFESGDIPSLFIYNENLEELWNAFRKIFLVIEAAGGLVWNKSGEFIAIKRFGKWDLPKGKKKDNENTELCAIREVSEECGISEPEIKDPLCVTYHIYFREDTRVLKETHWFDMLYNGPDQLKPLLDENITEARWFKRDEAKIIIQNTYPSIIDILEKAGITK